MNVKMPDFNVKKLVKEAGSTLSRVVQLTEEKLGTSEKTELDSHFENLSERAECTKLWTEKLVRNTEAVLIPNPGNRVEDFIFEKIEKKKPNRLSNLEYLGLDMIEAGGEFGQDGAYGSTLIKVGQAEQKLGQCERDFIGSAGMCYTQPLKKFLEGEMKTIIKEKGILETKRLDLDACKNRVRKARSMLGQQTKDGIPPEVTLEQAERDLRIAQSEFDRQGEITKLLLEGISTSQSSHLRHLHSFVEVQVRYFNQCVEIMNGLQRELASMRPPTPRLRVNSEDLVDCDASGPPFMLTTHNATSSLSAIHSQSPQLNAFIAETPTMRNLQGDNDEIINAFASIGHTENISSV
ncbi:endophilin-B1-like isoform X2 [Phlebotomus argentipes]|uniref:endophilin-B1-like isoform X2 n=1 Tax=Phlebotomus argentipes TaxID=94469 RepID=UPI002892EBCF|nr:endophilin-B1-like isoform X2 [Phlebotomus argentipes]XP_059620698.1 endophilin-B1-like isoform X2 [Phlebotomus argentipes]